MEAIPDKKWTPVTKLGRLVQSVHHRSAYQSFNLYLHSLPVKEYQIIDLLVSTSLKDEVMKIMHVQKQTRAGQRRRFKAFVVVRDGNGHVGLGVKCSKEVATAIRGGIILAKLSVVPVRRGYCGNKIGKPHTIPFLKFAGIDDVFTSSRGSTKTLGNFVKVCLCPYL
ncbi:unnamed protein product [Brassica oleracea var. botrytis]